MDLITTLDSNPPARYIPVDLAGDDIPKIQGLYGACPADKSCRIVEKETVGLT